ncbi:RNA polymerase, sigma 54 (sigma N) factor [Gammaproteobacteria bacterium]
MKQSLQLRLGQQLTMTPQLQQAIRLLQLSTLELQLEIQQALESNPMLEELNEGEQELADEGMDGVEQVVEVRETRDLTTDSSEAAVDAPEVARDERDNDRSESELDLQEGNIPDDLAVDSNWEDHYDLTNTGTANPESDGKEYEGRNGGGESLCDHLLSQIQLTPFSPTDEVIATVLVDSINEDGYLSCSLEEIQATLAELEVGLDEIEAVLHQVQNFDPVGIGARDLRECLLLQLRALPATTPWRDQAYALVSNHLGLLARHDFAQLSRRMGLSEDELRTVVHLIQQLNPRPGGQMTEDEPQYVVPDVIVSRVRGTWKVELNADTAPRLRVNPRYASLVRRADNSPDNTYLRNHLQEARWFLKSLQSRNETLLKVATAIVERQRAFLEQGDEAMRPLVLHDISEAVGMHESTISRVTTQKYMNTPRGIYELKYFFSSHLNTSNGDECSSTAIRALIRRLVTAEEPGKPLSDNKIAELLGARGIQVARRTVAKYREAMAIPPSSERKRLA